MKICLCIYILILQIESSDFALIIYTAVSKMLFLGYLKGPLFNCVFNYFFYLIDKASVPNFADDNSLSAFEANINNLKLILKSESKTGISRFQSIQMIVNSGKFQGIIIDKKKNKIILLNTSLLIRKI